MDEIIYIVLSNLEKVGIGVVLFLAAYLSNMGLGAWRNVKMDGESFDIALILKSLAKFAVLVISIAALSIVVSLIPIYISYIGIEISPETLEVIDSIVILGAFLTATLRYISDGIDKIKTILGV